MAAAKQKFLYLPDGKIDTEAWLNRICHEYELDDIELIRQAALIAQSATKGLTTFYGKPCIEQSLEIAETLLELKLDQDAIAAGIISSTLQHTSFPIEKITEKLGEPVTKLVNGVLQMNVLNNLATPSRDQTQIDRLRKLFLAMASDIRVILIKLAERTCVMHGIKHINPRERKRIAQETMDVYAPLANRLGIGQLKWQLEDIAFHYTNPDAYKTINRYIAERRDDREKRIHITIAKLKEEFAKANIKGRYSGRAKHIYSIYLKSLRKNTDYKNIYDYSAIRVLVPTLSDCYTALSIVHRIFEHVPEEFDDYISKPKPNGYRSIHTAVIGQDGKHLEIQIRTQDMHQEAEHGIAAHWIYKENKAPESGYETKITYLRQLLAWRKDVSQQDDSEEQPTREAPEDSVYVFTPAGQIIDLPNGSTPLDFAYHIHSDVGHRCRGAKINGHIVPITYHLRTGDQVEIITNPHGTPSRDWLNKDSGYLATSRARGKVAQWFKAQDISQHIESGKHTLERELTRASIHQPNIEKIAAHFDLKDDEALYAAIGRGAIKMAQILHLLQQDQPTDGTKGAIAETHIKRNAEARGSLEIAGMDDLLTRIARCCKPIPGDKVIGYITQGKGVTIHRENCNNVATSLIQRGDRIVNVVWDTKKPGNYYVDLQVRAIGQHDLLKEVSGVLANLKVDLVTLNSTSNKKSNMIYIMMTIQIHDLTQLNQLVHQISHLPKVVGVKRMRE